MPKYKVMRSDGWPVLHQERAPHRLFEEFESNDPECEKGVEQGYLVLVDGPSRGFEPIAPSSETHDVSVSALSQSFTKEEKATLRK